MECALLERMYFCRVNGEIRSPLSVDSGVISSRCDWFRDALLQKLPSFTPVSLWDFSQMYRGSKKLVYERAVDSLWSHRVRRRDAESNSFVKREKAKFRKAPRCIQPRDPRYNASIGRYLKPLEHHLYRAIGSAVGEGVVVTKGCNLIGTASALHSKWQSFHRPVAVGLDATAFDAHVSSNWLRWEHEVYNRLFRDPKLAQLLTWQIDNRGKSFCPDGKLRYRVDGRRFSGDMNTALGNCLIMCTMVYSYARERGVRINLANNGDDCVVFMEQEDLDRFSAGLDEWFEELGFRLTVEPPAYVFEAVEFCQMHPVQVDGEYRMVRNPRVVFEKDTMCTLTVTDEAYLQWLSGVSECGLSSCAGVPVLQEFYQHLKVASAGHSAPQHLVESTGMRWLSRGMNGKYGSVAESTRYSFWLAFGISPETQRAVEDELLNQFDLSPIEEFVGAHWPLESSTVKNHLIQHDQNKGQEK